MHICCVLPPDERERSMIFAQNNEKFPLPVGVSQPFSYYGVHSEEGRGGRLYTFRFFMPDADSVSLVSAFASWEMGKKMTRLDGGVWELVYPSDRSLEGECYKYKCTLRGEVSYYCDPFATREEGCGGGASVIATEISKPDPIAKEKGEAPIHLLEVSLASFMTRHNRLPFENGGACRYRELAEKLVIYAKSTGYTHLKLLPRKRCENLSLFAPSPRHGTPEEFSAFVDILHKNGLRVLVSFYAPENDEESTLVLSASVWFLSQYAVDGVYFEEASHTPLPSSFKEGVSRLAFRYPDALFMGDALMADLFAVTRSSSREDVFVKPLMLPFDQRQEALSSLFCALCEGDMLASQSKSLTRGGERSLMEGFWGSYEQKFSANRLYQLLLTVAKGEKLSFMTQSLAPFRPWRDELLPEWYMADFKLHRANRRFVRALNQLYLETPILYHKDRELSVVSFDADRLVFSLRIFSSKGELLVVCNASDRHAASYRLSVTAPFYTELFSSDEESFAGEGYVHRMMLEACSGHIDLDLAPLSAVILQPRL